METLKQKELEELLLTLSSDEIEYFGEKLNINDEKLLNKNDEKLLNKNIFIIKHYKFSKTKDLIITYGILLSLYFFVFYLIYLNSLEYFWATFWFGLLFVHLIMLIVYYNYYSLYNAPTIPN